jgi:DnaJ-class molecular chaperone
MKDGNYYERLEVSADAPKNLIQEAYLTSRKLFSEDSIVSHNFLSDAERKELLDRIREAYETLMDEPKRIEYDKKIFNRIGSWYSPIPDGFEHGDYDASKPGPRRSGRKIQLKDFTDKSGYVSLRKIREALGVSLQEMSNITRIRIPMVMALEDRNFGKLPPEIYVKGYLKSCANVFGIAPERLLRAYGPLGPHRY